MKKILILHNIRSALNVGAMFRTADAIGMTEIILSGYTATPLDRFGRPDAKVAKSALGAQDVITWRQVENIQAEVESLRKSGVTIVSVEQTTQSIDYKEYAPEGDVAIIMGNEVEGVEQGLIELSDTVIDLPMRGIKESLNVTTACGIVLFRLFDA